MIKRTEKSKEGQKRVLKSTRGAQFYLVKFYSQSLWKSLHKFTRSNFVTAILLITIRAFLWEFIAFDDSTLSKLKSIDSYLELLQIIYPLSYME